LGLHNVVHQPFVVENGGKIESRRFLFTKWPCGFTLLVSNKNIEKIWLPQTSLQVASRQSEPTSQPAVQ
jgi:hypothetical protein